MLHAWAHLACKSRLNSRLMPKTLGFLQWHVRPRVGAGPLPVRAYHHDSWRNSRLPTPMRILHSLVTIMTRCAESWRPFSHHTFSMARAMFMDEMTGRGSLGSSFLSMRRGMVLGIRWGGAGAKAEFAVLGSS